MIINPVGQTHALANDTDLQFGLCGHCGSVHMIIEGMVFACELQIQDAASARAIAADLLEAADVIEARTEKPCLRLVES
jgi:hypothetical protein